MATILYIVGSRVLKFPAKQAERVAHCYIGKQASINETGDLTRRNAREAPPGYPSRLPPPPWRYRFYSDRPERHWGHSLDLLLAVRERHRITGRYRYAPTRQAILVLQEMQIARKTVCYLPGRSQGVMDVLCEMSSWWAPGMYADVLP